MAGAGGCVLDYALEWAKAKAKAKLMERAGEISEIPHYQSPEGYLKEATRQNILNTVKHYSGILTILLYPTIPSPVVKVQEIFIWIEKTYRLQFECSYTYVWKDGFRAPNLRLTTHYFAYEDDQIRSNFNSTSFDTE